MRMYDKHSVNFPVLKPSDFKKTLVLLIISHQSHQPFWEEPKFMFKLIICNATTNFLAGYQKNTRSLATYIGDNFNVKLYLLIFTMARIRWLLMLRRTTTMETAGDFKLC